LLATTVSSHEGIVKIDFASSFGQLSATPFATFTKVSIPTTSAVRNVADFGLPIIGPVSASISSIPNPKFFHDVENAHHTKNTNSICNKGRVSLHKTVVFPRNKSPYCIKKSTISGSVCSVGIISNKS
jgi:hypothetical protein